MFDTIAGLPLHPLVVHATEVVVPVTALVVLVAALWPRFRRWSYGLPVVMGLASVVLVPLATQTGEALEERVGEQPLVEVHKGLAGGLLPWVIGLAVVGAAISWWTWRERRVVGGAGDGAAGDRGAGVWRPPPWVPAVLALAAVVASVGTTVAAVRIGDSGARAVWSGVVSGGG
jgi:hypothetical protein